MAKYIKHYYVDAEGGSYCCTTDEPKYKRHPVQEYPGLDIKVWLTDSNGVDVMLSEIPDSTAASDVTHDDHTAVKVLTTTQYNSVATPYFEAQALYGEALEAEESGDNDTAATKRAAGDTKRGQAETAIRAL